jgi:PAS domain S-box-containing protein
MAREGLLVGLRGAVQRALREGKTVREQGLNVKANGVTRQVNLEIQPVPGGPTNERCLLVTFEDGESSAGHARARTRSAEAKPMRRDEAQRRVIGLTQELAATREYLQSLVEQHEGSNEELQSANEEIQSTNEELQSVNEELQTSKEEIQSTNEELTTVNEELRNRNELLGEANADLANFLASTNLGLVVVGRDLRLRRFTSRAEKLFSLIPADVGRPIADLRLALDVHDLESSLSEVIRSEGAREEEVQDKNGQWYSLRLRPYRTIDNKVDGVVIVLVDIDAQKRAQAAIEESEQRFRLLADNAPVLIWVNDVNGRTYVNRTYREFLGVGEAEATGPDWSKFVHPDDRAAFTSANLAAVEHQAVFRAKFRLRRADGEYRWMNSVGVPRLGDGEGAHPVGYVGSTYDVDDLIRAQDDLRVSQESLAAELAAMKRLQEMIERILQDDSLDSILPETVDAAIEIAGADMGSVQLLDRDTGSLRIAASRGLERPVLDYFAHVALDDPTALGVAMRRGERVIVEDVTKSEIFAGTPALDVLIAAGVRAFQSTPLMSRSGALIGLLSTHYRSPGRPQERDLRVLDLLGRQAADAIERSGNEETRRLDAVARYQQLVELISAGVYVVDTDGVITFHNRQTAELRGRAPTPGESEEQFWAHDGNGAPRPLAAVETLRSGASVRGREVEVTRPNGSRVDVRMNADAIRDSAGRVLGAGVVLHDVTDLKQAEAVLTDADQRKDQFIAMLAHELRNPLAALRLTIEVIRRERDHRVQDDDLAIIDRQMTSLAQLVDDLLDVSRIRLGKIVARRTPVDLRGIAQASVDSAATRFAKGGRTLTLELPPEPLTVEGNAEKLSQAITNLLDNSFRHTGEGGHTTVSVAPEGDDAVIRVRDTGEGISEELLPHVFELFVQGEGQRARSQGGLGIGLFLVAKIAALHGGSVGVRSDGTGKGAEFFVRIPQTDKAPIADPNPTPESNGDHEIRPLRILAIEDNPDVGDQLAVLLRGSGHKVRLERTGEDGIAAVAGFKPDAILLDIGLPDLDGREVARRIRALPGFAHVVIVAVTGYTADVTERGHDDLFDEFLTKPVRPNDIEGVVLRGMAAKGDGREGSG